MERLPISVVIPAYNRELLLERSLQSVRDQRPRAPLEVIVVDDCSSDDTGEVARRHGARVIRHRRNRGEGEARNSGIEAARGEWIALLDSDDQWLPDHLARLWENRAGRVVVANSALACGRDPADDRIHGVPRRRMLELDAPRALVWPENPVPASGGMILARVARAAGGYRPLPHCADLDFLLRCLEQGSGVVAPEIGTLYHLHPEQVSSDRETMQVAHTNVCASYSGTDWWSAAAFERWCGLVSWDRFQEQRARSGVGSALGRLWPALRRPRRMSGVVGAWVWRWQLRRRSGRVGRDGGPTLALLAEGPPPQGWEQAQHVDLRDLGRRAALTQLLRRPTAAALVEGSAYRIAVRLLGVRPLRRSEGNRQTAAWDGYSR